MLVSRALAGELPSAVDGRAAYGIPVVQPNVSLAWSLDIEGLISEMPENLRRLPLYRIPSVCYLDMLGIAAARKSGEEDAGKHEQYRGICMPKCRDLLNNSSAWETCTETWNASNSFTTHMRAGSDFNGRPC